MHFWAIEIPVLLKLYEHKLAHIDLFDETRVILDKGNITRQGRTKTSLNSELKVAYIFDYLSFSWIQRDQLISVCS